MMPLAIHAGHWAAIAIPRMEVASARLLAFYQGEDTRAVENWAIGPGTASSEASRPLSIPDRHCLCLAQAPETQLRLQKQADRLQGSGLVTPLREWKSVGRSGKACLGISHCGVRPGRSARAGARRRHAWPRLATGPLSIMETQRTLRAIGASRARPRTPRCAPPGAWLASVLGTYRKSTSFGRSFKTRSRPIRRRGRAKLVSMPSP